MFAGRWQMDDHIFACAKHALCMMIWIVAPRKRGQVAGSGGIL